MASLSDYYRLVKPGIVTGNAYHVLAGAFLAYQFDWRWQTAAGVLVGTCMMIASACTVNNYFDRHQDAKMMRTQNRPLANGRITTNRALSFALVLLLGGLVILMMTTNWLTVGLGVVAYLSYAFVYTFLKKVTAYNTIVGTLPGALPGVAGYTAFSGQIDSTAWLIFIVLALWQLPHFYAIAIRRRDEYQATDFKFITASLKKRQLWQVIIWLTVAYGLAYTYLATQLLNPVLVGLIALASLWWISIAAARPDDYTAWAKRVFVGSLGLMVLFCLTALANFVIEKSAF